MRGYRVKGDRASIVYNAALSLVVDVVVSVKWPAAVAFVIKGNAALISHLIVSTLYDLSQVGNTCQMRMGFSAFSAIPFYR